jgi:hypothetical protein
VSRSGYSEECDDLWALIRWRGAVASAIRGRRGQAFIEECLAALDALPEPRLESSVLVSETGCCAMGAVAKHRGLDVSGVDPWDREQVASTFGIAEALAAEIAHENDNGDWHRHDTPEQRFARVRAWLVSLRAPQGTGGEG